MAIAENPSPVHVKVFSRLVTDQLTSARDGQTDGTLSKSPLEETTGSYKRSTPGSDRPLYVFPAAFPGQPFQLHLRLQMIAGLSLLYNRWNCCQWSPIFFLSFWLVGSLIHSFFKDIHKFVSPSLSQIFTSKFAFKRCSSKTSNFVKLLT